MAILSLLDGSPHPRAQQPSILLLDWIEDISTWVSAEIYRDFFAILIFQFEDMKLAVFNWVTGRVEHVSPISFFCVSTD